MTKTAVGSPDEPEETPWGIFSITTSGGAYSGPITSATIYATGGLVGPVGPGEVPALSKCQPLPLLDQRLVAARRAVDDLLTALGVPRDDHTAETPNRVAKSFLEMLAGYDEDPTKHLERTFPGPADAGVVVLSGIRFTSLCAHHLLPFTGTGTVAYLPGPNDPIVGLSKLARVLDGYARRLQTQELLGTQVADALVSKLNPLGAACILTSTHDCMAIRGVRQPDAVMTTSSLRGSFQTDPAQRAELMALHGVRQ